MPTFFENRSAPSQDFEFDLAKISKVFLSEKHESDFGWPVLRLKSPIKDFVFRYYRRHQKEKSNELGIESYESFSVWVVHVACEYVENDKMPYGLARIEDQLANIFQAYRVAYHALDCPKASENTRKRFARVLTYLTTIGSYFFMRGRTKLGIKFAKAAIRAHKELGETDAMLEHFVELMSFYCRTGDADGLRSVCDELKAIDDSADQNEKTAMLKFTEGQIARLYGKAKEALALFQEAKSIYEATKLGDSQRNMLGMICSDIGRCYEDLGDAQKALEHHQLAKATMPDSRNLGSVEFHIGNALAGLGRVEQALNCYRSAYEHFLVFGQQQYISNAIGEIGFLFDQDDETLNVDWLTNSDVEFILNDLSFELSIVLDGYSTVRRRQMGLVRKFIGTLRTISRTEHFGLVEAWADASRVLLLSTEAGTTVHYEMYCKLFDTLSLANFAAKHVINPLTIEALAEIEFVFTSDPWGEWELQKLYDWIWRWCLRNYPDVTNEFLEQVNSNRR